MSKRAGLPFRRPFFAEKLPEKIPCEQLSKKQLSKRRQPRRTAPHENAAKAHLVAADSHAKGDSAKGTEHAKVAKPRSQFAAKQSDQVSAKSQLRK
jgi:hypothetical protein